MSWPLRFLLAALISFGCSRAHDGAQAPDGGPATRLEQQLVSLRRALDEREGHIAAIGERLDRLAAAVTTGAPAAAADLFTDPAEVVPPPVEESAAVAARPAGRPPGLEQRAGKLQAARALGRRAVAEAWRRWAARFAALEDLRFELVDAQLNRWGSRATCTIEVSAVGRHADGRQAWLRGGGTVRLGRTGVGPWMIEAFVLQSYQSLVARPPFSEVGREAGLPDEPADNVDLEMGAAVADADGDGDLDLFVVGERHDALYLNDGAGRFQPSQAALSLGRPPGARAPLWLDVDNDGDPDLFLTFAAGSPRLYENRLVPDGALAFRDVSASAGLAGVTTEATGALAGDLDRDGLTDILVCGYGLPTSPPDGLPARNGARNLLLMNCGKGTFVEQAAARGLDDTAWTTGGAIADVNGDGALDVFLANDFGPSQLYLNEKGHFRPLQGALAPAPFARGAAFGDFDNDGDLDLVTSYFSSLAGRRILAQLSRQPGPLPPLFLDYSRQLNRGNRLFENLGGGAYRDVSRPRGPFLAGHAFGAGFLDYDNDGWLDLHAANGQATGKSRRDAASPSWREALVPTDPARFARPPDFRRLALVVAEERARGASLGGDERDHLYRGHGHFADLSGVSGLDSPTDGRATVYADFDGDGDTDIFVTTRGGRPRHLLFRNEASAAGGWIRVSLVGSASGRDGWGAVVRLKTAQGLQTRLKAAGQGYLSQSDPRLLFGLGGAARAEWVEVVWPSGQRQRAADVLAGSSLLFSEGRGSARLEERPARLGGRAASPTSSAGHGTMPDQR